MEIKEIEDWAKPIVDSEVDSEMYSRLAGKCKGGTSFATLLEETTAAYYFPDAVYVESLLAAAYFFKHHQQDAHPIYYNCKRMIESGLPIVSMKELEANKDYLKMHAQNIRLFYDRVLAEGYGPFNEESPFAILEKQMCY
ncbi:MAG: hypothetical protein RLZZ546_1778 [Bacteroidota bacterium]|jgi:hypothetical protein